jgi:multiple sugar transport system substrate-binding protein
VTKTLKFWVIPNADFDTKAIIEKELNNFRRLHKGIEVECEVIPWIFAWSRIMKAAKEKAGVDVLMLGSTWVQTLAHIGALMNLDGLGIDKESFIPSYVDVCTYHKSLWAIPWFCEAKLLYYRKDHLAKAGIDPAELDNWDGFIKACARLSAARRGGKNTFPMGFSIQSEPVLAQDLACFIWAYGGDFVTRDGKGSMLSDQSTRNGLKKLLRLISMKSKSSLNVNTGDVVANFFFKDVSTFMLSAPWSSRIFLRPDVPTYAGRERAQNIGITLVPGGDSGRYNFCGGATAAITSFTPNRKEAGQLVKFLTSAESMKRYCKFINAVPARAAVEPSLPVMGQYAAVYRDAVVTYGRHFPKHPLWGSIERVIVSGMSKALNEYCTGYNERAFFKNVGELNDEIQKIFSLFGGGI